MFTVIKFLHIPKKNPKIKSKKPNRKAYKPKIFKTKIIHAFKKEKAKKNSSKFLGKKTLRFVVEKKEEFNTKKLEEKIKKNKKIKKLEENNVTNEGRWIEEEHDKFLDGIAQYGINWKKIKPFINSRTGNQIRSHAQKFYKRLKKCKDEQLGIDFTKDDISSIIDMINQIKEVNSNYNIKEIFKHLSDNFDNRTKKFDFHKYENNLINNNNFLINQKNEFSVMNNIPQLLNTNQIYNNDFPLNNKILFNNLFDYKNNLNIVPLINNLNNICPISPNYNNYNNNEIAINNNISNTNNPLFTSSHNKSIH
jgi:SHAQKYF class myb-like DNA-binding protein